MIIKRFSPMRGVIDAIAKVNFDLIGNAINAVWDSIANLEDRVKSIPIFRSPYINVRDYGAKGDGTTDDTAAIAVANSAASGGTLVFPPGAYNTTGITFGANVAVHMMPGAYFTGTATISKPSGAPFIAGLMQVFDSGITFAPGEGVCHFIPPQWWGGFPGGTDSSAATNKAVAACIGSRIPVRIPAGYYTWTGTVNLNNNRVVITGDGPQSTLINFTVASTAIKVNSSGVGTKQYCRIENLGIQYDDASTLASVGIDMSNAPSSILRNLYLSNLGTGILGGNCYNSTLDSLELVNMKNYGIKMDSNSNGIAFKSVTIDGQDYAGSRGLYLESSHGCSAVGLIVEDFEWGCELSASGFAVACYMESMTKGCFLVSGNRTSLHILHAELSTPSGTTYEAFIKSTAGVCEVTVSALELTFAVSAGAIVNGPDYVFDMAGFANLYYPQIVCTNSPDPSNISSWLPGGSNFANFISGDVLPASDFRSKTSMRNAAGASWIWNASTVGRVADFLNPGGNGGIFIKAGNNKVNDGSEKLIELQAGDGTAVMDIESGGRVTEYGLSGTGSRVMEVDATGIHTASIAASTLRRLLWTKTASTTVANTVAETTLLDTGSGSKTLSANTLTVGRIIPFSAEGYLSTTGTPTLQFKLKLGSVTVLDSGAVTMGAGVTNKQFRFVGSLTCRSTGASGTVFAQGRLEVDGLAITYITNTATTTLDTTATQSVDFTATWGTANAANTATLTNAMLEGAG